MKMLITLFLNQFKTVSNSTLYYNLGIAYYLEGEKRKARKFLKRAKRKGSYKAGVVLSRMKKKGVIDKSYLEY